MRAFVTPELVRYIAESRIDPSDTACEDRPTPDHEWVDGFGWRVPADIADRKASVLVESTTPVDRLWFEVTFQHENRLRQLEGQQPITRQAFKTALLNFAKQILSS